MMNQAYILTGANNTLKEKEADNATLIEDLK